MAPGKIKALVIDDSAFMRKLLSDILGSDPAIEVIGAAQDPIFAMNRIRESRPDVITLDVEMPRMDGLEFLEALMKTDPIPVVMVSALTERGCDITLRALELGAVEYVTKPGIDIANGIASLSGEILHKVKVAAGARVRRSSGWTPPVKKLAAPHTALDTSRMSTTDRIIAIGASTGGTEAITSIVSSLPASLPGVVIVQHMPPLFTTSFARRLNSIAAMDVREANGGDRVLRGTVLLSPGDLHMTVRRNGAMYYSETVRGPMVNFVRPSVDVLFSSVAKFAGKNAIGIILTGMGEDGARGLLEMKRAGAFTIVQDEASSVVFGMPKKAIEMGAADRVLPLEEISEEIMKACS